MCVRYHIQPDNEKTEVKVTWGNTELESQSFSKWREIAPFCVKGMGITACLELKNMQQVANNVHGCLSSYLKTDSEEEVYRIHLGCRNFIPKSKRSRR